MASCDVETALPRMFVATHLTTPESLSRAPLSMTTPPSSSSFISIRSQVKSSISSLYHCTLGLGVPRTRTRNSIWKTKPYINTSRQSISSVEVKKAILCRRYCAVTKMEASAAYIDCRILRTNAHCSLCIYLSNDRPEPLFQSIQVKEVFSAHSLVLSCCCYCCCCCCCCYHRTSCMHVLLIFLYTENWKYLRTLSRPELIRRQVQNMAYLEWSPFQLSTNLMTTADAPFHAPRLWHHWAFVQSMERFEHPGHQRPPDPKVPRPPKARHRSGQSRGIWEKQENKVDYSYLGICVYN